MPTTILKTYDTSGKKPKETTLTVNVTHNNARVYYHTDGETYYYTGNDASGNRIYKNARKVRL